MRYLIRRLAFYMVALWASVTINFVLPWLIPGNPFDAYIARLQEQVAPSPATIQALEDKFGGSDAHSPILVQYFHYLSNILHGNLGTAFSQGALPVTTVLAHALPWTLGLGNTSVASWGTILYWAQQHNALLGGEWWEFVPAGLCIAPLCTGLSCVNFGIDALANPALRTLSKRQKKSRKVVA